MTARRVIVKTTAKVKGGGLSVAFTRFAAREHTPPGVIGSGTKGREPGAG